MEPTLGYTTNLYAHWKANSLVLADDAVVTTWLDQTANNNDLSQNTIGYKPTYKTNIINGFPVVRFDGVDDYMQTGSLAITHPYSLFLVCAFRSIGTGQELVLDGEAQQKGAFFRYGNNTSVSFNNDDSPGGAFQTILTGYPSDQYHYYTIVVNDALSYMRADAGTSGTGTLKVLGLTKVTLGTGGNLQPNEFGDVDIAEILYYTEAISDTNRDTVEAYLNSKYFNVLPPVLASTPAPLKFLASHTIDIFHFVRSGDLEEYEPVASVSGINAQILPAGTDIVVFYPDIPAYQLFDIFIFDTTTVKNGDKLVDELGAEYIVRGITFSVNEVYMTYQRIAGQKIV